MKNVFYFMEKNHNGLFDQPNYNGVVFVYNLSVSSHIL